MEPFDDLSILHQIMKPNSKSTNPNNLFAVINDYYLGVDKTAIFFSSRSVMRL